MRFVTIYNLLSYATMPTSNDVLKLPFVYLTGITKDFHRMNWSIFYKYRII